MVVNNNDLFSKLKFGEKPNSSVIKPIELFLILRERFHAYCIIEGTIQTITKTKQVELTSK